MLITATGRKTGRSYSTPVGFYREGTSPWVLASRDRTWWRNVRNGARVSLLLKSKTIPAFAEAELDQKNVEGNLLHYFRNIPMSARSLDIRMDNKTPNKDDMARVTRDQLFMKTTPNPSQ